MKTSEEIQKIESIVLGYILNNESLYISNTEYFNRGIIRESKICVTVFDAFKELISSGVKADMVNVSEQSKVDITEVAELYTGVDYRVDFKNAIQSLVSNAVTINLIHLLSVSNARISRKDDIFSIIKDIKDFISSNETEPVKRITHISEHIKHLVKHMEDVSNDQISGIRTGLAQWDEHTGGLQPSDLVVIAGETSQGKTSLALSIARNSAVYHSAKVAIFSLEMSGIQLTARLTSMETGISSKKLLFHKLENYDWEKLNNKLTRLPDASIYIDDCTNSNIDYIISGIKIAHLQLGIQVAIVDYLQLVKDSSKHSDESEIASNTRRFKNVAKELNITVILLSQLRRSDNPRPTINKLRGSGQIEEAADIIAMVWRPEFYNIITPEGCPFESTAGLGQVIIAKGRNYGIGSFWLNFQASTTLFSNIEYDQLRPITTNSTDEPF